jgi:hypothetical protein
MGDGMTSTKNFKVLAVLASMATALTASLLLLSLFEKPAIAQAGRGEDAQGGQ